MARSGFDAVYLLTGYPSLYARRMLRQILSEEPRALVQLVVPAAATARAKAELEGLPPEQSSRVEVYEGDASYVDLGLSGAEFNKLTSEVDFIHHMAHVSAWGESRKVAHAGNVVSAAEILEFAKATRDLRCLVFHSTAHVSGSRTGVIDEDDLSTGQTYRSEVEETRTQAEAIVRRAMRTLPIAIVRPTTVVGDFDPVEDDRIDGLYLLVLLIVATPADIAIPFPGRGDLPLNIVPLDYVVKAAHHIGQSPLAAGRTFHLADPHPLSAHRIAELISHASGKPTARSRIPANLARALLRTPGIERFVRSPRAFVEQLMTDVRYDTRNADRILADSGITCPSFETYVDQLVSAVQEHLRRRRRDESEPPPTTPPPPSVAPGDKVDE